MNDTSAGGNHGQPSGGRLATGTRAARRDLAFWRHTLHAHQWTGAAGRYRARTRRVDIMTVNNTGPVRETDPASGVRLLTLSLPKLRNAMTAELTEAWTDAIEDIKIGRASCRERVCSTV